MIETHTGVIRCDIRHAADGNARPAAPSNREYGPFLNFAIRIATAMSQPIPYQPDRFKQAAQHYLNGRPAYSPALIRRVAASCGLDGTHRLLDLGCGPGQLSLAFAPFVGAALALDPEPEMLRIAATFSAGLAPNIEHRQGSSYDVSPELGRFRLVVIGRAFHWMDRADTLRRLDALIEPGGALALFGTRLPEVPAEDAWQREYRQLIDTYANDDPARAQRRSGTWESHETVLLASPFPVLERIALIERRRTPLEHLLARALSMSSLSRQRLGARLDELLEKIEQLVKPHACDGHVHETVESSALIARRPMS